MLRANIHVHPMRANPILEAVPLKWTRQGTGMTEEEWQTTLT